MLDLMRAYFLFGLLASSCLFAADYEDNPIINSNEVLSSRYLSSPNHRVESIIFNHGNYEFLMETDYGTLDLISRLVAKKRIDEILILSQAIKQYESENTGLSEELRSQLIISGDSALDLLTSPLGSASRLAGQVKDNFDATLQGEDPYIRNTIEIYRTQEPKDPTTAIHKRNAAFQLGLDLYSNNQQVQSFLNTIAKARSSGRVSVGVGFNNSFSGDRKPTETELEIRYKIKQKNLTELLEEVRRLLEEAGIHENHINAFIETSIISPSVKLTIATYLEKTPHISRLDKFIELITSSTTLVDALQYEEVTKLIYTYQKQNEAIKLFHIYSNYPGVITDSNKLILFETKDYIIWTKENEQRFNEIAKRAKASGYNGLELVSAGRFSNLTGSKLNEMGYQLHPDYLK